MKYFINTKHTSKKPFPKVAYTPSLLAYSLQLKGLFMEIINIKMIPPGFIERVLVLVLKYFRNLKKSI